MFGHKHQPQSGGTTANLTAQREIKNTTPNITTTCNLKLHRTDQHFHLYNEQQYQLKSGKINHLQSIETIGDRRRSDLGTQLVGSLKYQLFFRVTI